MKRQQFKIKLLLGLCCLILFLTFDSVSAKSIFQQSSSSEALAVPTESEVYSKIIALQGQYPEGMKWDNSNSYQSTATGYSGLGCHAFALLLSDAGFGSNPITKHTDASKIRVGDIVRCQGDTHSVIVLQVSASQLVVAEGNYNGTIHWGRSLERSTLNPDYILTRYNDSASDSKGPDSPTISSLTVQVNNSSSFTINCTLVNGSAVNSVEFLVSQSSGTTGVEHRYLAQKIDENTYSYTCATQDFNTYGNYTVTAQALGPGSVILSTKEEKFTISKDSYTLSLSANPEQGGSVTGSGSYSPGQYVSIEAKPETGYIFDGWYEGNTKITGQRSYQIILNNDMQLTAKFVIDENSLGKFKDFKLVDQTSTGFTVQTGVESVLGVNKVYFEVSKLINGTETTKAFDAYYTGSNLYEALIPLVAFDNSYGSYTVQAGFEDSEGNTFKTAEPLTVTIEETPSIDSPITDQSDTTDPNTQSTTIYRLFNKNSGEHLYTPDQNEAITLAQNGWTDEGMGWSAPAKGIPVYRLYSPASSDHLYTTDTWEVKVLTEEQGWQLDNNRAPLFYSGGTTKIYRLFNRTTGRHHLTKDDYEYSILPTQGWEQEGIKLQAIL